MKYPVLRYNPLPKSTYNPTYRNHPILNLSYVIYENINGRYKNNLFKKWIIAKLILEAIGSGRAKKTASRLKIPDVERFIDIMRIIMVANLVPPLDI